MITRAAPDGAIRYATCHVEYAKAGPSGRRRAVMSTPKIDRMGDILDPMGCDYSEFQKNPVMLYEHRHDEPVGIWLEVEATTTEISGVPVFHPAELNPFGHRIGRLYETGWLKTFSVGFIPLEWEPMPSGGGWFIKKWKLLECSAVTIPANSDAIMKGGDPAKMRPVFAEKHAFATPESRLSGRNLDGIRKWIAPATELRVESKAMTIQDLIKDPVALAELRKALGSIKDEQPAPQSGGDAPPAGDEADTDDDLLAVALAETEAVESEALAAEIEDEAGN